MATSLEKIRELVEQFADADEAQLAELAPHVPPMLARPIAFLLPKMLPDTVEETDHLLDVAHGFIENLRSDPA
jgi:hypothetical protein